MGFEETVEHVARAIEAAGVAVVVFGIALATVRFVAEVRHRGPIAPHYRRDRQSIPRAILLVLGLVFLEAGDIIHTVAIRTFLRLEREMEIEGRWPWQRQEGDTDSTPSPI